MGLTSMILNKIIERKYFFIIAIAITIMQQNNFFYNIYNIINQNLEKRLIRVYGDCDKHGYGFISEMYSKYSIKENILVLNDDPNLKSYELSQKSAWFNYQINKVTNESKIILINSSKNFDLNNKKTISFNFKKKNFSNFKIIYKKSNCYYLTR